MTDTIDNLKINIAQKPVGKKRVVKKKVEADGEAPQKRERRAGSEKNPPGTVIAVIATAIVIGAVVYGWQHSSVGKKISDAKEAADKAAQELQKQVSILENKVEEFQQKTAELETTKEDLEKKVSLLGDAKKDFMNEEIGVSFSYPAILGDVQFGVSEDGKSFSGQFTNSQAIVFGGENLGAAGASSTESFLGIQGFTKKKDKYYIAMSAGDKSENVAVEPVKIIGSNGNEVVILGATSFSGEESGSNPFVGSAAGYTAAVVNLKNKNFPAMVILDKNRNEVPEEDFESMAREIVIR